MLAEVARHADQLFGQLHRAFRCGSVRSSPASFARASSSSGIHAAPDGRGECAAYVLAQPHHFADLTDRRARAIVDHRRCYPRTVAAVFVVNVLDHLLAPLMLEIDIDVGRLLALLGDEALEQQVAGRRINRGDTEAIADRAVRRRAAALAQDRRVVIAGEVDDVVDSQEVGREVQPLDERQLAIELPQHLGGNSVGPAALRAFPGLMFEICVGGRPSGTSFSDTRISARRG